MEQIREGLAVHGAVYFAHAQTEGRGQRGKKWWSAPGENIQMTLVLQPLQLAASQPFRLSATLALAIRDFLSGFVQNGWAIKWPNDVYWGDRKAGGILIENVMQAGNWMWAVVGIGININTLHFDAHLPNPTSLRLATQQPTYDTEALARQLCLVIEQRWQQLNSGGWPAIWKQYNQNLYKAGQLQRLKLQNTTAYYQIKGVSAQGQLIAGMHNEFRFDHGEVEWMLES